MTFLSFMKKEKTRKVFEKSIHTYGKSRYDEKDENINKTDYEGLREFRNRRTGGKAVNFIKAILLLVGFALLLFFIVELFLR